MKTATRKTALLVIDVQESFRSRPYWQPEELPAFLANTQRLIDACVERGVAVLQVFHRSPGRMCAIPSTLLPASCERCRN
jgi:nicotinamidase-related amidase